MTTINQTGDHRRKLQSEPFENCDHELIRGGRIDPNELGEPPLANTEDSLLDRDRIHVENDTDEE